MQEDGLDIFQIIDDLLLNKYKIIIVTIIFTIIGYLYNIQKISSVEISLPINEISKSEESKLASINLLDLENSFTGVNYKISTLGKNRETDSPPLAVERQNTTIKYKPFLTSSKLIEEFYNEFNQLEILKLLLLENYNYSETEIMSEISRFRLNKNKSGDDGNNYIFTLSSDENKLGKDKNLLIKLVQSLNTKVKLNLIEEIYNIKKSILFSDQVRAEFIQSVILKQKDEYGKQLRKKIKKFYYFIFLRDNFNIDVETQLVSILNDSNLADFIHILYELYDNKSSLDFNSIDNLIQDVKITDDNYTSPYLENLNNELMSIKTFDFAAIVEDSIKSSGLISENYNVVLYDYSQVEIHYEEEPILNRLFVFPVFGFILSSLLILIYFGYKRNRESFDKNK